MTTVTPNFRRFADKMSSDLVVVPRFSAYLAAGRYPKRVDVSIVGDRDRPANSWFWPSTHPGWSERALYFYLTDPGHLYGREWAWESTLSASVGTLTHEFVKACLVDEGLLLRPDGDNCPSCGAPRRRGAIHKRCNEWGYFDAELGSRGHCDGVLQDTRFGVGGYDLKTTNSMTISKLQDNDLLFFRKKWPYYYDQTQEYMRLSGLRFFVVHFLALGFPWKQQEVMVPFDPVRSYEIETKYRKVRAAVEAGEPPRDCCTFFGESEKDCPAKMICRSLR